MNEYLNRAISDLGATSRHALKVSLTRSRDRAVGEGRGDLAEVWNALACTVADIEDRERSTLAAMEADLGPVVRPLTVEELAASAWPDDEPDSPC